MGYGFAHAFYGSEVSRGTHLCYIEHIMACDQSNGSIIDRHENFVNKGKGGGIVRESLFSEVAKSVCLIHNTQYGTGFICRVPLDGKDRVVLVTVSHVMSTMETAMSSEFTFQYVKANEGVVVSGSKLFAGLENTHKIHPPQLANKSLGLDYFICQVNTECLSSLTDATSNRPLHITPFQVDSTVEVTQGDAVYVIQHPKGQPRSVSSYTINHVLGSLLFYQCDTDAGSSGSPVFKEVNGELKIVALHRGGRDPRQGSSGYNIGSLMSVIINHVVGGSYNDHMPTNKELEELEQKLQKLTTGTNNDMKGQSKGGVIENQDLFLRQLMPFLQDIEGKWKEFAIALDISEYVIDNIKADCLGGTSNAECCLEMFTVWRRSTKQDKRKWWMIKKAARTLEMQNVIKVLEEHNINDDKEPKMSELQKLVCPLVDGNWFDYGQQLEIKLNKLNAIRGDHSGGGIKECMRRVINHWVASNTVISWERILSALEDIGEINLRETIRDTHAS